MKLKVSPTEKLEQEREEVERKKEELARQEHKQQQQRQEAERDTQFSAEFIKRNASWLDQHDRNGNYPQRAMLPWRAVFVDRTLQPTSAGFSTQS
jgi:hypothetical protein